MKAPPAQEIQGTRILPTLISHGNDPACCSVSACLIKCTETFANRTIYVLLFIFITAAVGVPINIRTLCLVQMSVVSVLTKGDQIIQLPTPNINSQITRPFHVDVPFVQTSAQQHGS